MIDTALSLQHARDNVGDWMSEFEEICDTYEDLLRAAQRTVQELSTLIAGATGGQP